MIKFTGSPKNNFISLATHTYSLRDITKMIKIEQRIKRIELKRTTKKQDNSITYQNLPIQKITIKQHRRIEQSIIEQANKRTGKQHKITELVNIENNRLTNRRIAQNRVEQNRIGQQKNGTTA